MFFQEIWDSTAQKPNRTNLSKLVKSSVAKGYVKAEPKDWKHGKKRYFSLTAKGQKEAIRLATKEVNEGLRTLEDISSLIASNPAKLKEFINRETEQIEQSTFLSKGVNNDSISEHLQKQMNLFKPIKDACRSLHKVHSILLGNGNSENSVTLIYGDKAMLVKKDQFEGLNIDLLQLMPLSEILERKNADS